MPCTLLNFGFLSRENKGKKETEDPMKGVSGVLCPDLP